MPLKKIRNLTPQDLASASDEIIIAWNFIRIREDSGLTQQKAADLGESTVGYVGKVETAAVSFGTRAQQKWSKIFKVDRTEFLKRPKGDVEVIGTVMDKGIVNHTPGQGLEYVPSLSGYTEGKTGKENILCLKVATDTLYPHLRRDSYLYIAPVPLSAIHNDDFVMYAEPGNSASIKEVERLDDRKILLKGLGRGSTVTIDATDLTTIQKIIFIGM